MSLRTHARWPVAVALVLVAGLSGWAAPAGVPAVAAADPPPVAAPAVPAPSTGETLPPPVAPNVSREVYGYLPYWEMTAATEHYLRYDLLTTIAFFGVPIRPNGTIGTSTPGGKALTSARAKRIIANAHAAGVRAEITFTAFGFDRNAVFFRNGAHLRQFVKRAVALMQATGADGIDLDVELLASRYYKPYGVLVRWLKEAAVAVNPAATVSVATNANVSGARMARIAAANGADRIFMMGYDYRWAGSDRAGAVDPLVSATKGLSLSRSIALYKKDRVPLDRVILGLSNYGRGWPTVSSSFHARVRTDARYGGSMVFLPRSIAKLPPGTKTVYDRYEQSIMLRYWDPDLHTWIQIYVNDPRTLAPKLELTNDRALAGVGIWALGYDRGQPGFWDAIEDAYALPPASPAQPAASSTLGAPGADADAESGSTGAGPGKDGPVRIRIGIQPGQTHGRISRYGPWSAAT